MKRFLLVITGLLIVILAAACNAPLTPPGDVPATGSTPTLPVSQNPSSTPMPEQPTQPVVETATQAAIPTQEPVDSTATVTAGSDTGTLQNAIAQAFEERDVEQLRSLMGDSFMLARWRSEGHVLTRDEAAQELSIAVLPDQALPVVDMNQDTNLLLEGANPFNFLPAGVEGVKTFFVKGLGERASDEAIVYIAREHAGGPEVFYGVLIAMGGYQVEGSIDAVNTVGESLAQAVQARDFEAMRALMRPRFSIATFNKSLYEYTSEEALEQLRQSVFAEGSAPEVNFQDDVPVLLGGRDPLGEWGPVAQPVRAVHMSGLGSDAQGEAVLVIAHDPETGGYYWHGILLPESGNRFSK